jgi:uncharacterized protein (DUF433 family)
MIQHIHLDDRGIAWVDDTNTKVSEIVEDMLAYGWSAEEVHFQHPHLSLAQIHAALAYYYDHQEHFDQAIASALAAFDRRRAESLNSPMRQRLAKGQVAA